MSYRTEPVTMWFDRRLVLRDSPIHGTGTFATDDIWTGETLIWVTGGLVFRQAEWDAGTVKIDGRRYNEARLADGLFIVTPVAFHYYLNHSCEPNAIDQSRHPTAIHYIALRDIHAEEEITADYYTEATLAVCLCGSPNCRWAKQSS
jgi:SET domain-containing protein